MTTAQPASSTGMRAVTLVGEPFFVPSQVLGADAPARGSIVELAIRQVEEQRDRFNIVSTDHFGGTILTCTPMVQPHSQPKGAALPFIKLRLDQKRQLTQAEVTHPVERDRYGNSTRLRTTVAEFHVPAASVRAASAQARGPAWTAALQTAVQNKEKDNEKDKDTVGKSRGRPLSSPTSPASQGRRAVRRRIDAPGAASSSAAAGNSAQSIQFVIPWHWPAEVRAAAELISHFEKQLDLLCLQHAYNNALNARLFVLASDPTALGYDIGLVCSERHGAPQPLQRLVLDHGQLSALIPVLSEHLSQMIVFRGNLDSGDGHYQALRKINGHVFLLDSLQEGPQWLPDPDAYFRELLHSPGKLIGAMPPFSSPMLESYGEFLSGQARQDIARGLGDVYGVQPIVPLQEYFASQEIKEASPAQLAAYCHWQGLAAQSREWLFDDLLPLRNIDITLSAAGSGQQRVLLMTRTHPYLIPAYFSAEQGAWQARVPNVDGGMETQPLQAVLDAQQRDYDRQHAQHAREGNAERLREIDLQRRGLGAVWLQDWPLEWPPVCVPADPAAADVAAGAGIESREKIGSRTQAGDAPFPWKLQESYMVTGVVPKRFRDIVRGHRWRRQEFVHLGMSPTFTNACKLSAACDKVRGLHIGEGVFVHDDVALRNGKKGHEKEVRKVRVYRKLGHDNVVLDIGVPIVGWVNLKNIETRKVSYKKNTRDAGSADATTYIDSELVLRGRMFEREELPYPLMGNKKEVVESEPTGIVLGTLYAALNAPGVSSVVDAFAGSGFLTLWVAAQRRRGLAKQDLRLIMNEWDQYRYTTLKTIEQHPEQVKQALHDLVQRVKHVYYRAFHNYPAPEMVNNRDIGESDEALARRLATQAGLSSTSMTTEALLGFLNNTVEEWVRTADIDAPMNTKFSKALKAYILGHIVCPLPPEPEWQDDDDIRLRASNAAIYLLAQHNGLIISSPVNFSLADTNRSNRYSSEITMGYGGNILNRMLANSVKLTALAGKKNVDKPDTTKLSMDLNYEPDAGGKDTLFHNLPWRIDRVHDALTGVDIRRGDGWELLRSAQKGAFALIDPPYWGEKKKMANLKVYGKGSCKDYTKTGFLNKVDQHAMPAWKNGVRMMMFNRWDGEIANEMESRGFHVTALSNLTRLTTGQSNLVEFMAVNFHIDANATLRPFVTHPSPVAPLGAPADAPSEEESEAMP